jgi:ParB family chromosome partitioning protein
MAETKPQEERIYPVPLDDIKDMAQGGLNVRMTDRDVDIEDLAESIKKHGLLQPILLRGKFGNPPYDLIAGHRRLAAHRLLKMEKIEARFKPPEYDDFEARVDSLVENMQRVKLNHADAAEAITMVYNHLGKRVKSVADELGISGGCVREYLKIEEQATPKMERLLKERGVKKEDIKRVIKAAQGNMKTADELLDYLPILTTYDKKRMAEIGSKRKATAKVLVSEAKKPRFENVLILELAPEEDKALEQAAEKLDMDKKEVAAEAIRDWLTEKGFLSLQ